MRTDELAVELADKIAWQTYSRPMHLLDSEQRALVLSEAVEKAGYRGDRKLLSNDESDVAEIISDDSDEWTPQEQQHMALVLANQIALEQFNKPLHLLTGADHESVLRQAAERVGYRGSFETE